MIRTLIGLLVGAGSGFALGYYLSVMTAPDYGAAAYWSAHVGVWPGILLGGLGAMSGAFVGAVGDVMAFLKRLFPAGVRVSTEESEA